MKLLIIRHGDPDYSIDSLTEKGWNEAKLLSERMQKEDADYYYCSILGRAKGTASLTLEKLNKTAVYLEWLKEFDSPIEYPQGIKKGHCWDLLPRDFANDEKFFDINEWYNTKLYKNTPVKDEYNRVCAELDKLLEKHGYARQGNHYNAFNANDDTLAFFCHFGLECVLLSHLLNIPAPALWQGTMAAPTSVTTLYTEEREQGIAYFRMQSFGDNSHLYVANEPPAFAGRFCEKYDNFDERH